MNSKLSVLCVLLAVAVAACSKKLDEAPPRAVTTNLNVVNATTDTLNYYLNGNRVNRLSSIYPFGSSGYLGVAVGEQNYEFRKYQRSNVLFSLPMSLDSGKVYSLYVAGEAADNTFMGLDTLIADDAKSPRAMVRFVNASPDAGSLDVRVGDTVRFNVRPYKSISVFLPVGPGLKRIRMYHSGNSTTPLVDTNRVMNGSRIYTLFSRGSVTGTGGKKFGTGLFVNR